jgi:HTH-type transcriptional regulator/antitoxin HigA
MDISPIKNQRDYRKVLKEIEGLMSAKRKTPEGDRLDVLVTLVGAWERKRCDSLDVAMHDTETSGSKSPDLIQ